MSFRSWLALPDRRELTLLIFSLTVFTLAFNFSSSIKHAATPSVLLNHLGFGTSRLVGTDGRRLLRYRDTLENFIYGEFEWERHHIAGHGFERTQQLGVGDHNATWASSDDYGILTHNAEKRAAGGQGFWTWGNDIPTSTMVKHTPGYSIFDNVVLFKGIVSIVTDTPEDYPALNSIVSARGPGRNNWEVISTVDARGKFGTYGSVLNGVSWLVADPVSDNATLPALWRTYSSLDPNIDSDGRTILPAPQRIFFPHINALAEETRRSDVGFHPLTFKVAFPHMSIMFREDWEDYHSLEFPFVLERVVVADRTAASHLEPLPTAHASAFDHPASAHWWEPIKKNVHAYFSDVKRKRKKIITYIERQLARSGPKLKDDDHAKLLRALAKMASSYGYEVHVVSALDEETEWSDRLQSIVQSTVVVGIHGVDLMDAIWMNPTEQTTLVELFPADSFVRDREVVLHGLGMNYVAVDNAHKYTIDDKVSLPGDSEISVNADLVVQVIREALSR